MRVVLRVLLGVLMAGAVAAVAAPAAHAHAELVSSDPADGATLSAAPPTLRLAFSETPATASRVVVVDGCGRDVTGPVEADGDSLTTTTSGGQPGAWTVEYSVLSDVDGHPVEGGFGFTVTGTPDCSAAAQGGVATPTPTAAAGPVENTPDSTPAAAVADDGADAATTSDAGGLPAPLLAAGAVVLLAGAGAGLAVRRQAARRG